jgi:hypothetical protein
MRTLSPFRADDLEHLDGLLARATAVVPMLQVAQGVTDRNMIGLRHDVDNVIEPAVAFAEWEAARGYHSTYYILHSAHYWTDKPLLRDSVQAIHSLGHEIGLHNDAIAEAVRTGREPIEILNDAALELSDIVGHRVVGTVAHGNPLCYRPDGHLRFVNDEIFRECGRHTLGRAEREVAGVELRPVPLATFGFLYDANWLSRGAYLSDSGGRWSGNGFDAVAASFPFTGQLHMLVHPDWWVEAFQKVAA